MLPSPTSFPSGAAFLVARAGRTILEFRSIAHITGEHLICVYERYSLSIDDDVMREARRRAEVLGTSVNQLVRDYLEGFVGKRDPRALAEELRRLWEEGRGDSHGWKFNREEIHDRKF